LGRASTRLNHPPPNNKPTVSLCFLSDQGRCHQKTGADFERTFWQTTGRPPRSSRHPGPTGVRPDRCRPRSRAVPTAALATTAGRSPARPNGGFPIQGGARASPRPGSGHHGRPVARRTHWWVSDPGRCQGQP
jgi:hypothetical protein